MSKLDGILSPYSQPNCFTDCPDWGKKGHDSYTHTTQMVKEQVKALLVELVGKDEKTKWQRLESESIRDEHRNKLRKELREKINLL